MLIPILLKKEINRWFKRRNYSTATNARRAANHVISKALGDYLPYGPYTVTRSSRTVTSTRRYSGGVGRAERHAWSRFSYSINKMNGGSYRVEFNFN